MKASEMIEHIKKYYLEDDQEIAGLLWTHGDIRRQAECDGIQRDFSNEECNHILKAMERCADSNLGMSWDTVSAHIATYCAENNIVISK